ncbi:MAG: hypothetical protein AB7S38_23495 [Vulcanimicrobiota bacterium]
MHSPTILMQVSVTFSNETPNQTNLVTAREDSQPRQYQLAPATAA